MAARLGLTRHFVRRVLSRNCREKFGAGSGSSCMCPTRRSSAFLERHWRLERTAVASEWLPIRILASTSRGYSALVDAAEGPLAAYQRLCKLGKIKHGDPPQEKVIAALDKLSHDLLQHREPRGLREWFHRIFGKQQNAQNSPQGLYIYGGVGRGKTMLMDLFYDKVNVSKKRRVHFHAFMLDIHGRLHKILREKSDQSASDSIKIVAEQLMKEVLLLCLDEVEVTDVGDALILRRLFEVLWPMGMVVVATSNSRPDELYRGGLNRPLFEPFIKQLKEHCCVYGLDESQSLDYRRGLSRLDQLYLYPLVDANDGVLNEAFTMLTGGVSGSITEIPVMMGRHLQILASKGVARTAFSVLCGGPYGAADYMAIAQSFQALFLERIPWLGDPALENEARRFITLIDVLYESNILFVCSAAVSIDELFVEKPDISNDGSDEPQQVKEEEGFRVVGEGGSSGRSTLMIGEMEWSGTGRMGASIAKLQGSSSFTRSATARTASRLLEMQSPVYLKRTGTVGSIILSKLESTREE
ncbi:unnamed protein product [Calypogeia fissa]